MHLQIYQAGESVLRQQAQPLIAEDIRSNVPICSLMQAPPHELNPDLPVNPNCASCLDAEGWTTMVVNAEARFQSMLTEP